MSKQEELLSYMKFYGDDLVIQQRQTAHRMRLVEKFDIRLGDKVLEVGCGQGDTTVVLADAIGENGHVHAVDIAEKGYGAPVTVGEAAEYISRSPIGDRITFSFETDVTEDGFTGSYDVAVLSHSLFYFSSVDELANMLAKLRILAGRICVSDWDLQPASVSQLAHAQAILLQGLYARFNPTDANVRTIVTKKIVQDLFTETGWELISTESVPATELDDVRWEIATAKELTLDHLEPVFSSYIELMRQTTKLGAVESLNSFVMNAH